MTSEEFAKKLSETIDASWAWTPTTEILQLAKDYLALLKSQEEQRAEMASAERYLDCPLNTLSWAARSRMEELSALNERLGDLLKANDNLSRSADHWRQRYVAENSELLRLREQVKREKAVEREEHYFSKEQVRAVFGGPLSFQAAIPHPGAEVSRCKFNSELWTVRWPKVTP